jgi:hypothetical protein
MKERRSYGDSQMAVGCSRLYSTRLLAGEEVYRLFQDFKH